MLVFATEIPITHQHQPEAFKGVLREWLLGSPHTAFSAGDLADLGNHDWTITKGSERIETLCLETSAGRLTAMRYARTDSGLEWATTIVCSSEAGDTWIGIRVFCESTHPAVRLPPAKKPVLLKSVLSKLGGGTDGGLVVSVEPNRLHDVDIDLAARLIRGDAGTRLPVVYLSARFLGGYLLDPSKLAADLGGVAHVVVEPNRPFSVRLRQDVDSQNVYGGTIGIYWPEGTGRRAFFLGQDYDSARDLHKAIVEEVRLALANRRPLERCTWAHARQLASRLAQAALRAAGSKELDAYAVEAKRELDEVQEKLDAAERDVYRLQQELRKYEKRHSLGTGVSLKTGVEQDLYAGEISDILLDAIKDSASRAVRDSRRAHVLDSVVAANPPEGGADRRRDDLKALLRGSTSMDAKLRRGLEDLGFAIEDGGKHFKITFQGDDRYTFTLPKSGSDHRGGLNAASDIARLLL